MKKFKALKAGLVIAMLMAVSSFAGVVNPARVNAGTTHSISACKRNFNGSYAVTATLKNFTTSSIRMGIAVMSKGSTTTTVPGNSTRYVQKTGLSSTNTIYAIVGIGSLPWKTVSSLPNC